MIHAIQNRSILVNQRRSIFTRSYNALMNRVMERTNRRATFAYLQRLTDRELRDIGMTRNQVDKFSKKC